MLYYLLLAPAAAISHADPVAVTALDRARRRGGCRGHRLAGASIGGPLAGVLAGLLMAVSASAVDESTFIWNPNLIALSGSIALAAAWRAWQTGRARWWVVAGAAAVVTMQCHVLGVILSPIVGGLLVADILRRRRAGDRAGARAVVAAATAWIALLLVSYVPLLIHELSTDFSEMRAAAAFVTGGGPAAVALPARLPIVGFRVLGWPLAGLITDAPVATFAGASLVVGLAVWRGWLSAARQGAVPVGSPGEAVAAASTERTAVRWLAIGLLWSVVALAVGASSLATVVIGLPNDHYHAFADPIVFVLVGVGLAAVARSGRTTVLGGRFDNGRGPRRLAAGAILAAAVVASIAAWNLARQPPPIASDGSWPAAEAAAARVLVASDGQEVILSSLPGAKSAEALRFPLERIAPGSVVDDRPVGTGSHIDATARVVLCDQLFHDTIGADCGGPAEDATISAVFGQPVPGTFVLDRFEAAPGRWISIYRATTRR